MTAQPRHMAPRKTSTTARVAIGFAAMLLIGGAAGCTATTLAGAETVSCQEVREGVYSVETVKRGKVTESRTTITELLGDDAKACGVTV